MLDANSLKNRVAIVTGSSSGIGFAAAKTLGELGASVILCATDKEHLEKSRDQLRAVGIRCESIVSDVTDSRSAPDVIAFAKQQFSSLDILVNNAGGIENKGHFFELSDEDWRACFEFNLFSVVRFCREAIPLLRQSANGRIINISSITAKQPGSYNPHYSSAKIALANFTKHLSGVLAQDGILVNSVSPGIIHTAGWDEYLSEKQAASGAPLAEVTQQENERVCAGVPLARLGTADEVASLIGFLASDCARFITGSDFAVDGGKFKGI